MATVSVDNSSKQADSQWCPLTAQVGWFGLKVDSCSSTLHYIIL